MVWPSPLRLWTPRSPINSRFFLLTAMGTSGRGGQSVSLAFLFGRCSQPNARSLSAGYRPASAKGSFVYFRRKARAPR